MTACRACKSQQLYMFLSLGWHPPANAFLRRDQLARPEPSFPLDAYVCLDCGLIQIRDNVPAGFFRNYVYIPSTAQAMHTHFAELANVVVTQYLPALQGLTIDIGCNDGLFLKCLQDRGVRTLGVDPATNIVEMARQKGLNVINEYFTPEIAQIIKERFGPAAVVVTTNTLHHIGDLDAFIEGAALLLEDHGVFIVEVPHALEIIEQNQFDGIYHEHVSQFTVKSLRDLFRRFDLELFHLEQLDVHGGSLRTFARKGTQGGPVSPAVSELLLSEAERGLFCASTYNAFRERVRRIKAELLALLSELKQEGKRIVGYGASARGNTLLNYYGISTHFLDYIVDRNSLKHGLYSPGMHIPVVPVERLVEDRPDYVLLLAWNFADEIIRQQEAYRRLGGRFIAPIPEPRIIADGSPEVGHG